MIKRVENVPADEVGDRVNARMIIPPRPKKITIEEDDVGTYTIIAEYDVGD